MLADPPALREALERDGEVAALREELPLAGGFALYVALTRAPRIARALSLRIADVLDAEVIQGALTGAPEDCARRTTEAILATRARRVLDLGHAMPRNERALQAVLARLNERRSEVARGEPVVLVVPVWFEAQVSIAAPDLWSVRSEVFRPAVDLRVSEHDEVLLASLFASGIPPHDYSVHAEPEQQMKRAVAWVGADGRRERVTSWLMIGDLHAQQGRWRQALSAWSEIPNAGPESDPFGSGRILNEHVLQRMAVAHAELGEMRSSAELAMEPSGQAALVKSERDLIEREAWRRTAVALGGHLSDAGAFTSTLDATLAAPSSPSHHLPLTLPDHLTGSLSRAVLARNLDELDAPARVGALIARVREDRHSWVLLSWPLTGEHDENDLARVGWAVVEALLHAEALLVGATDPFDLTAALATLRETGIVHPRLDVERACVALHLRAAAAVTHDDALARAVAPLAADAALALDRLLALHPVHPWWPRLRDGLRRPFDLLSLAPRVVVLPGD